MNPIIAVFAVAVTVGAVAAISAREPRLALVGLALTLGAASFLSDPLPPLSTLAVRVVGAALAAYLLRAALTAAAGSSGRQDSSGRRADGSTGGSRLGWPAESLIAVTAWIVAVSISVRIEALRPTGAGVLATDLVSMLTPDAMITAAGLAAIVVALVTALSARDGARTAVGTLVLMQGLLLFRIGVAGSPGDLEQLVGVALLIAVAIAGSVLSGLDAQAATDDRSRRGSHESAAPTHDESIRV